MRPPTRRGELLIGGSHQIGRAYHEQIVLVRCVVDATSAAPVGRTQHIAPFDPWVFQHHGSAYAVDHSNAAFFFPQSRGHAAVGQDDTLACQGAAVGQRDATGSIAAFLQRLHHTIDETHPTLLQRGLQRPDHSIGIDHAFPWQEQCLSAAVPRARGIGRLLGRLDTLVGLGEFIKISGDSIERCVLITIGRIVIDQYGPQPVVLGRNLEFLDKRTPHACRCLAQLELQTIPRLVEGTWLKFGEGVEHGCRSHRCTEWTCSRANHLDPFTRNVPGQTCRNSQADHAIANDQVHGCSPYSSLTMHNEG